MTKNNKDALLIEKKNRKLKDEISKMKNRLATAFDIDTLVKCENDIKVCED